MNSFLAKFCHKLTQSTISRGLSSMFSRAHVHNLHITESLPNFRRGPEETKEDPTNNGSPQFLNSSHSSCSLLFSATANIKKIPNKINFYCAMCIVCVQIYCTNFFLFKHNNLVNSFLIHVIYSFYVQRAFNVTSPSLLQLT